MSDEKSPTSWAQFLQRWSWAGFIIAWAAVCVQKTVEQSFGEAMLALVLGLGIGAVAIHSKAWLERANPKWIYGASLIILLSLVLSPYVEARRWPFASQLAALRSPTAEEIADAVAKRQPPSAGPSAEEMANNIISKLAKMAPVYAQSIPTAADIAKEIVRQSPQPANNQDQRINELTAALEASNKNRDEINRELISLRNKMSPSSPILGINDATRWQIVKSLQVAAVNSQGNNRIACHTIESIDNENKNSVALFSEFTELLARSWRVNEWTGSDHGGFTSTQGLPPPPHQPFGITLLVAGHTGDAFACANHAAGVLQNLLQVPISLRVDQASDNLAKCNNQCVEIRYGGER